VLVFLAEATILSTILSYIIVYVGLEVILDFFFPVYISIPFPFNLCGLLISVLGFTLIVWANYTLLFVGRIGLKNREPFHIPHKLILEGPYKFSRNPIYLSGVIIIFGLAIFLGSLTLFIISIALFIIFRILFIRWEEKKLEEAFGEEYLEYKKRVRRWI
jgi:protein-S-isoprenylcysteine O-methyltransferase Ste14